MDIQEYQQQSSATAIYPNDAALPYLALGLSNEAGEAAGKVKKFLRGDFPPDELRDVLEAELGDVLWYMAQLAELMGLTLDDIAAYNLDKLQGRLRAGTLQGDGDDR